MSSTPEYNDLEYPFYIFQVHINANAFFIFIFLKLLSRFRRTESKLFRHSCIVSPMGVVGAHQLLPQTILTCKHESVFFFIFACFFYYFNRYECRKINSQRFFSFSLSCSIICTPQTKWRQRTQEHLSMFACVSACNELAHPSIHPFIHSFTWRCFELLTAFKLQSQGIELHTN